MTGKRPAPLHAKRGVFLLAACAVPCKKPFKLCSRIVYKWNGIVRYTIIVGREIYFAGKLLLHLVFIHLFFFTLFFHFAMESALPPLTGGQGAFRSI